MFNFSFKFSKYSELTQRIIVAVIGLSVLFGVYYFEMQVQLLSVLFFVLYSELLIMCYESKIALVTKCAVFILGLLYMIMGLQAVMDAVGMDFIVPLLLSVFAIDTVAYFAGKILKGPKLWKKISPKKTWAGAIAGLIAGVCMFEYFFAPMLFVDRNLLKELLCGFGFAVITQLGDLLESLAKRVCLVKDASKLLPGHGGLWDRCDSIFAGAIFITIIRIILFGIDTGM